MTRHLLLSCFILTTSLSWAQSVDYDNLYTVLVMQRDTSRISTLRELGWGYWDENRHDSQYPDQQCAQVCACRQYLRHVLSPHFYTHIVGDAEAGLRYLERESFDLVLSDLMLPGIDGMEFLERVRGGKTVFRHLPFLMLTARTGQEERLHSMRLGVDDYLTKPFQAEELVVRLRNVLANYRIRQGEAVDEQGRSASMEFLRRAEALVKTHLSDNKFGVKLLAQELAQSQRNLERVIKAHTGLTPVAFLFFQLVVDAYFV